MTHPPSLTAKWIEGALDLVLRAGSDPAARGQGQPVPRPETDHDREDGPPRPARQRPRPVGAAENGRGHAP